MLLHHQLELFSYMTGKLISNSGPDLLALGVFRVSSGGLHEGIVATQNAQFMTNAIVMIDGTLYDQRNLTALYEYFRSKTGQRITAYWRIDETISLDE